MNPFPIIWMPTLYLGDSTNRSFAAWRAQRFLNQHGGRGHIIAPWAGPWPSSEVCAPHKDTVWYCRQLVKVPAKSRPQSIALEIEAPDSLAAEGLRLIDQAGHIAPLRRLILTRPAGLSLERLAQSVGTLLSSLDLTIWLDVGSVGHDATAYLCERIPALQLANVGDHELAWLIHLANALNRPLILQDLSGVPGKPLAPLPQFFTTPNIPRALNSLPIPGRNR